MYCRPIALTCHRSPDICKLPRRLASKNQWRNNWLISFNMSKLVIFHHHRTDPIPATIWMHGHTPKETHCLENLLVLKCTPNLKWNLYIYAIAKDAGRMVGYLVLTQSSKTPYFPLHYNLTQQLSNLNGPCIGWTNSKKKKRNKKEQYYRVTLALITTTDFHCPH